MRNGVVGSERRGSWRVVGSSEVETARLLPAFADGENGGTLAVGFERPLHFAAGVAQAAVAHSAEVEPISQTVLPGIAALDCARDDCFRVRRHPTAIG
jgi:hypothetical protein